MLKLNSLLLHIVLFSCSKKFFNINNYCLILKLFCPNSKSADTKKPTRRNWAEDQKRDDFWFRKSSLVVNKNWTSIQHYFIKITLRFHLLDIAEIKQKMQLTWFHKNAKKSCQKINQTLYLPQNWHTTIFHFDQIFSLPNFPLPSVDCTAGCRRLYTSRHRGFRLRPPPYRGSLIITLGTQINFTNP